MSKKKGRSTRSATQADRNFASLSREVDEARYALSVLQRKVDELRHQQAGGDAEVLSLANEQLLLASLRAQEDAEDAGRKLNAVVRAAELDPLTGLPNRVLLLDRISCAITGAQGREATFALLFLDLNHFKQVNDLLGHAAGDRILQQAAQRLTSTVRGGDTVGRYSGDEFLVLLSESSRHADAVQVAHALIAALGKPSRVGEYLLRLTVSIGIAMYPEDGEDTETLIERADAAMYRAKRSGMGRSCCSGGKSLPDADSVLNPPQAPALPPWCQPVTQYEQNVVEQESRHAQLREANEQLVLAAISAQELLAAAKRAYNEQRKLLATVAHELRNPLVPLSTAAYMLAQVPAEQLPQVQALIERQVNHISRLVGDLVDQARHKTGKLSVQRRMVNLSAIIDEAIAACRPAMDIRLQHFNVGGLESEITIFGDAVRLVQVFSNLIDNASKYTPEGGVIELAVQVLAESVVIAVSDSGIGISEAALPNIFQPFVRSPDALIFSGAGLGIGLTVVRELVEAHGGIIDARSDGPGSGSCFTVTLPRHPPDFAAGSGEVVC